MFILFLLKRFNLFTYLVFNRKVCVLIFNTTNTISKSANSFTSSYKTTYGTCGVKVWVFKGEVMAHDPMAQDKRMGNELVPTDGEPRRDHRDRRDRRERSERSERE